MQRMSKVVLDASALLALLMEEPGHTLVANHISDAIMSAVNLSEVIATLTTVGIPPNEIENLISTLIPEIVPFDEKQAHNTGLMRKETKQLGLSLGDRACLSLAKLKNLPVLTADKIWGKLKIGVEILIIR